MRRRQFLIRSALLIGGAAATRSFLPKPRTSDFTSSLQGPPAWSFDPVVGDGKWIWREPPKNDRGYLEPRTYDVSIGVELKGVEGQCEAMASTPVPVAHPEQHIDEVTIEKCGCDAVIRELAPGAGQLLLHAPEIVPGQMVKAIAHFKITLFKQYQGFKKEMFPSSQTVPPAIRTAAMGDSPGIQTNASAVRKLAHQIADGYDHPWEKAEAFVKWIRTTIRPQLGEYTSVLTAIHRKVGDCEEMSALFVAFCRASGIPARLVWVPNHNWAEFYLTDDDQKGHWIPVHPALGFVRHAGQRIDCKRTEPVFPFVVSAKDIADAYFCVFVGRDR